MNYFEDTIKKAREWIKNKKTFTYKELAQYLNISLAEARAICKKKEIVSFLYKLRKVCLLYYKIIKVEKIDLLTEHYHLGYKITTEDNKVFYLPKDIVAIYGVPIKGSYFAGIHAVNTKKHTVEKVYIISFFIEEKYKSVFNLIISIDKWRSKKKLTWNNSKALVTIIKKHYPTINKEEAWHIIKAVRSIL